MMIAPFYIALGIIAFLAIWIIAMYNTLVKLRQHCRESFSAIETELQRRYDLIPNLVNTVKGYAAHEKQTLTEVIEARNRAVASKGSPESQAADENVLVGAIGQLFALSENYPDLKANTNFLQLQDQLANTEDRIQAARRFYNGNVREMNTRVEIFPSNVIAGAFTFAREEFFEISEASVRAVPNVSI